MTTKSLAGSLVANGALGRSLVPAVAKARADGLRRFPGLSNWLANPVGSCAICAVSDSTGASPNTVNGGPLGGSDGYLRWVDKTAELIAAAYPAITVRHWTLDFINYVDPVVPGPTVAAYQAPRILNTGTGGYPRATLPASSGQVLYWPRSNSNKLTGTRYFFAMKIDPNSWVPTHRNDMLALSTTGDLGISFTLWTDGTLLVQHSADGTTVHNRFSTAPVPGTTGTPLYAGVDANVDNGANQQQWTFYTSDDGQAWTQLGNVVTVAGASTFYNPDCDWYVGSTSGGGSATTNLDGDVYEIQVRKGGIYGPTILPIMPDHWYWASNFYPMTQGPVLDIVNASWSGRGLDEFDDGTNLPLMMPHFPYAAVIVSTGHNDPEYFDQRLTDKWDRMLTRIVRRAPAADIALLTQNPTIRTDGPTSNPDSPRFGQFQRVTQLAAYAQSRGIGVVDTFQTFEDYVAGCAAGLIEPTALQPDGVTPGDGTLADLIDKQATVDLPDGTWVHPKDHGVLLQAQKILDELVA